MCDFADSGESTAGYASLAWQALGEDAKRKHNAVGLFSRGFKVEHEAAFLRVSGTMAGALKKQKKKKTFSLRLRDVRRSVSNATAELRLPSNVSRDKELKVHHRHLKSVSLKNRIVQQLL